MALAYGLLTLGTWLIYSGLKGLSMIDVLAGKEGEPLDPKGGSTLVGTPGEITGEEGVPGLGGGGKGEVVELFYDPLGGYDNGKSIGAIGDHGDHVHVASRNKLLLQLLKQVARVRFKLKITSEHRPGDTDSFHGSNEAFDASGKPTNMMAFARYVRDNYV